MSSKRQILRLALPSPLRRQFDYLPPEGALDDFQPGLRFLVPFGKRELVGLLLETSEQSDIPVEKLRPAIRCLDLQPLLPAHLLELGLWAANYYQHAVGDALCSFLPVLLRKGEQAQFRHQWLWVVGEPEAADLADVDSKRKNPTQRQQQLLDILREHPDGLSSDALKTLGFSQSLLRGLKEKALVTRIQRETAPPHSLLHKPETKESLLQEVPLALNEEQQRAVDAIAASMGEFQSFLLQGITGSGKTEVYLQLIGKVVERGRQALVLVPEIGLTPQTVGRFRQRFNVPVAVIHSGLTDRERLDAWLMAQQGHAGILIGTRSALLTPLIRPGIIIIDEEHDGSFKQQDGFRYSARDLGIMRARAESIPIILGSATPSLESFANAEAGRYRWLKMEKRAGEASPPEFELLDIRQQLLQDGLSDSLIEQMKTPLQQGEQVLVFLNRRGFAPTLMCHDCGWQADCPQCDAHMTLHRRPPHLHCHHCDYQAPVGATCPECQGRNLNPMGAGTERTEEALQRLFPDISVIRVDRDSTRRKNAMQGILKRVHDGGPCILVGTQMLAKGHHFPKVTLVAILDADAGLFSADFRGMEKMAQLILQVAGRAGRSDRPGKVVMQTLNADHPRLRCLIEQGYTAFAREELIDRKAVRLPPFCHYGLLRAEAVAPGRADAFLQLARMIVEPLTDQRVQLLGPIPSPMERRAGRYRAQLLLYSDQRKALHGVATQLVQLLEQNKHAKKVRWSLDIDPTEMF
ncbi:primosomal protein N' [Motiliproteus sp. MSK22-1]|uniref:primosomal protein N' n=1 Tax=Motiliproteus sp. MSK22-1 TaxID=1897630 RepID=UPI00097582CE|nr:primosomal protein N' [Motiliproteus sp. MSK22-1]OMH39541.1 primosomal protein N' [Motiliproteus sp. MSK22-1]